MSTDPRPARVLGRLTCLALLGLGLLLPAASPAQVRLDGFSLQTHEPTYAGDSFFTVPDAPVPGRLTPAAKLTFNYGHRPLSLVDAATGEVIPNGVLVRDQLYLHLDAAVSLFDRLKLDVSLPFAVWQGGDSPFGATSVRGGQLGDLRLGARVALLGTAADEFALGLQADVFVPTGSRTDWAGDGIARGHPRLVASGLVDGRWRYAAALGAMIRSHSDTGLAEIGTALTYSAAGAMLLWDQRLQVGPEVYGATTFAGGSTGLEALLGAKVCLPVDLVAGLGIGAALTRSPGPAAVRVVASLGWEPERQCQSKRTASPRRPELDHDADRDGIPDDADRCPLEPETKNGLRDDDGCPEWDSPQEQIARVLVADEQRAAAAKGAQPGTAASTPGADSPNAFLTADTDGDGIPDVDDRCPVTREDPDEFEDDDGCPEPDNDEDGIPDAQDQCRDTAENLNGFEDTDGCPDLAPDADSDGVSDAQDRCPLEPGTTTDGCPSGARPTLALPGFQKPGAGQNVLPVSQPAGSKPTTPARVSATTDTDGDGIPDVLDRCPATAEDPDGFEDDDGCPELDNDADGVPDKLDACPLEAETINGVKDTDGCPDVGKAAVVVTKGAVEIKGVVQFRVASAALLPASHGLLRQVAATLKAHPMIAVEVQGHTDAQGDAERNTALSERRAQAIKDFLVKEGIDAGRLTARGYGPSRPRATNTTEAGREQNRRVEFVIKGDEP